MSISIINFLCTSLFQYQSRSSFDDAMLMQVAADGTTLFHGMVEEDRKEYLGHLATLPKSKKRRRVASILIEAGVMPGKLTFSIPCYSTHLAQVSH